MKNSLLYAVMLFLVACNGDSKPGVTDTTNNTIRSTIQISDIQSYRPNIELTAWEGDLYEAIYWRDSRGENAVIISGVSPYYWESVKPSMGEYVRGQMVLKDYPMATEIFAVHYVLATGEAKWKKINEAYEFQMGKDELMLHYQPGSLIVVDENYDGTGEVVFMYNRAEGGEKDQHVYTGKMVLMIGDQTYTSEGATGAGAEKLRPDDSLYLVAPDDYKFFLSKQWKVYAEKRIAIDRDSITEKGNVDEHGHADHVH